jgi:hypothetical protein
MHLNFKFKAIFLGPAYWTYFIVNFIYVILIWFLKNKYLVFIVIIVNMLKGKQSPSYDGHWSNHIRLVQPA